MKFAIAFALASVSVIAANLDPPALQPYPRECAWGEGVVEIAGLPVVRDDVRQCEIGAAELPLGVASRVYAGEPLGRCIYLAVRGSELAERLIETLGLDVPAKRQGYALAVANGRVAVVGHDVVGALYGAMTLCQLMADGGRVPQVNIRDWPDFAVRGEMVCYGGVMGWGELATRPGTLDVAALKAAFDEMMRHKLNGIVTFYSSYHYPKDPDLLAQYREIFAYAAERGIRPTFVIPQAVFTNHFRPGKDDLGADGKWPCVHYRTNSAENWYCWSRDDQTAKAAKWWADFLLDLGATNAIVSVHPRDSCGKDGRDPEEFSKRCPKCRERYADGERWKATADQLNIFTRVLKRGLPGIDVGSCMQPYQVQLSKQPADDEVTRRDTLDFWAKTDKALEDPSFFSVSWAASRDALETYRKFVPNRVCYFGTTYEQDAGVFATSSRHIGTMYRGGDNEAFRVTSTIRNGKWESMLLAAEYMWNAKAPGCEEFDGNIWYDPITDHVGPEVVMKVHLPAICRTFWGEKIAPAMVEFMSSGVLPAYLSNPVATIDYWNRIRKSAMYDPCGGAMDGKNAVGLPPVKNDAEFANRQVAAAERAAAAIEKARAGLGNLPVHKRHYLGFYLRRAPYWLATARVRAALLAAKEELESGKDDAGMSIVVAARAAAERDYAAADENAKALDKLKLRDRVRYIPYGLMRDEAMKLLERAERIAQAGRKADAQSQAAKRAACVAQAGVRDGRTVAFPSQPHAKCEVWSGKRIIEEPLVISHKNLYVMPGASIEFRKEGRIEVLYAALNAANAEFLADGPLNGNFRILIRRGECWLDNCRFVGMKCEKPANWGTGFLRLENHRLLCNRPLKAIHCTFTNCSSISFFQTSGSEISGCLFDGGETGVCALMAVDTIVERNVFRGLSAVGVEFRQSNVTDVVGNVFENLPCGSMFRPSREDRLIGNSYENCRPYRTARESKSTLLIEPLAVNE